MSECSLWRYLYFAYLSQPASDRFLYRQLRKRNVRSITELGIGQARRTRRLLELARRAPGEDSLRYTGIDLFEARPAGVPGLCLKAAHQALHIPGVRVQLVPGDPYSALRRVANTLRDTDLLLISADQDAESLARAWLYVPRMLYEHSLVLLEGPGQRENTLQLTVLARDEIQARCDAAAKASRRAA